MPALCGLLTEAFPLCPPYLSKVLKCKPHELVQKENSLTENGFKNICIKFRLFGGRIVFMSRFFEVPRDTLQPRTRNRIWGLGTFHPSSLPLDNLVRGIWIEGLSNQKACQPHDL